MPLLTNDVGVPGAREINRLAEHEGFPSVSLFVPDRQSAGAQQDRIHLGNLLASAEELLKDSQMSASDIGDLLAPARALLRDRRPSRALNDSLAIYLHPGSARQYRVPLSLAKLAVVGERYQVTPLLPILPLWGRFHLLALSQNQVRLFEASGLSIRRMEIAGMPAGLADAVNLEDKQQALQFHTGAPGDGSGSRRAMYHGHGGGKDDREKNLVKLCRSVDAHTIRSLGDLNTPLVVAAEEHLFHLYRRTSKHPRLIQQGMIGNPDDLDAETLRRNSWQLAKEHLNAPTTKSREKIANALHQRGASTELGEILEAARQGRVDIFMFSPDERQAADGEDLLNLAAVLTLRQGGSVHAVPRREIPEGAATVALFRY